MPSKTPEENRGLEFDWLATDVSGNVAFFSTAGGGYAPPEFLSNTEIHDRAIERLLGEAVSTTARFKPDVEDGLQNPWLLMAERGVYSFDSDPQGGPYVLVAAPEKAIHISALPSFVADVAKSLSFPKIRFAEARELTAEALKSG